MLATERAIHHAAPAIHHNGDLSAAIAVGLVLIVVLGSFLACHLQDRS